MTGRARPDRACKRKIKAIEVLIRGSEKVLSPDSGLAQPSTGGEESDSIVSVASASSVVESVVSESRTDLTGDSSETVVGNMSDIEEEQIGDEVREREARSGSRARSGGDDSGDSESGSGSDEDASEPSARELMKLFHGFMTGFKRVSERGSDTLLDKGRMVNNIPSYKEGSEIAKYIRGLEADLKDIGVSRRQYKRILLSKLTPKAREQVVDLVDGGGCTYDDLKKKLLEKIGLSRRDLEIKLFNDLEEDTRGMDRAVRYKHIKSLIDRVNMMCKGQDELALFFAKGLFRVGLPLAEQGLIDGRKVTTFQELNEVATTLKASNARTKDQLRSGRRDGGSNMKCFKCHGYGHKAFECRVRQDGKSSNVVCYTCNQVGHKSPDCPNKPEKSNPKENKFNESAQKGLGIKPGSKPKNANWVAVGSDFPLVQGRVNGIQCQIAPDTGAEVTIVPGNLVYESQLLPETVEVRGATGVPVTLCTAEVEFEIESISSVRRVAVAHAGMLCDKVLFSVPMDGSMARRLLLDAVEASGNSGAETEHSGDTPDIQTSTLVDAVGAQGVNEVNEEASKDSLEQTGEAQVNVVTRAGGWLESLATVTELEREKDTVPPVPVLETDIAESEVTDMTEAVAPVGEAGDVAEGAEDEAGTLRSGSVEEDETGNLGCPTLVDESDVMVLKKEVLEDDSLKSCRELGDLKKNGYVWKDGLLFHDMVDETDQPLSRLVLPIARRQKVLRLAHDFTGHVGIRRVKQLLNARYTWPGLGRDVTAFVQSCDQCIRINKSGNRQAQMVERPIVTEPFESVAVDMVGPLPKAKGGVRYILTFICMATRWPEAVPMRTGSAPEVAEGLISIFTRTSFPLKILSDRGSVFMGKVNRRLCEILGVDSIQTSPYRPQGNGVVERLHGTLKPMLAKAVNSGIDWSTFLPMALFAIRQVVNRDTGFSPHDLVFGRKMRGPLDIVYAGWVEECYKDMDVSSWVERLQDRLKVICDVSVLSECKSSESRLTSFNKNKSTRELVVGSEVLLRIPGLHGALEASWEGPYTVTERLSRVNYRVRRQGGQCDKIVHINNTKRYASRPMNVNAVCVVAEENKEMWEMWENRTVLEDEKCEGYDEGRLQRVLEGLSVYFSESPGLCSIGKCEIVVSEGSNVVNLPPRQIPVNIRQAVNEEIEKLLRAGIIVESSAEWCSPLVPVRKKDGGIRLCVDYREVNKITPLRRFWLPSLSEILHRVSSSAVLSKLDLTSGFHQITMDEASQDLTSFVCPAGRYKFVRMPFGLKNAPAVFQSILEEVLRPVSEVSCNYIDDVVVFSNSWSNHLRDLEKVIRCLGEAGLVVKRRKCEFGRKFMSYLGHQIGCGKVAVPEARVRAMAEYRRPITKKQLRSFLGSVGYYRAFVDGFAKLSVKLKPAVSLSSPHRVQWTREMEEAFELLRKCLCERVILHIPVLCDFFVLYTDASGGGVGACLHVVREDEELPVAFYSRQLRGAEFSYTVTELESLAIVASILHFDFYLYGASVVIYTDHRACTSLLTSSHLNRRLMRLSLKIQDRDVNIRYRPGRENTNADGLSRQDWDEEDLAESCPGGYQTRLSGNVLAGGPVGRTSAGKEKQKKTDVEQKETRRNKMKNEDQD